MALPPSPVPGKLAAPSIWLQFAADGAAAL